MRNLIILLLLVFSSQTPALCQAKSVLTVKLDKNAAEVQPTMWGIFFEDINFAADGGIYAELIKNRSFEFDAPLMGWKERNTNRFSVNKESGSILILNKGVGQSRNSRFARITVNVDSAYSITNEGFFGIGIKKDLKYNVSFFARPVEGNIAVTAELIDEQDKLAGSVTIRPQGSEWKQYQSNLTSTTTSAKGEFRLSFSGKGVLDLDIVSVFPADTWKQKPGGLRADLVQLLFDLKPGFLRFPGGCIVEGRELAERYQWKNTVGNVNDRQVMINRWNMEFKHRPAPDYFQSFGLGFYEYFELAEDIGAAPLPILSCGMACQFNTAEVVAMEEIDSYVQDALDLIEFANGASTSKWGKVRTEMGHPKPFNLKMIGVGNEQWGPQYIERYKVFSQAIRAKYPDVKIVSGAGPFADGELFEYAVQELKTLKADIVDEHYYKAPEWFFENTARYDNYDRSGPKIFAGEYAAQSVATVSPENKNTWKCALAEAAFMTGLERNADVVHLASYAPLFAHADGWQWTPDLIWFDNLTAYGTPSYYVQKLFSNNKGTNIVSVRSGNENLNGQNGLYASGVYDKVQRKLIIKIVNASDEDQRPKMELDVTGRMNRKASLTVLKGDLNSTNSFENPRAITPSEILFQVKENTFDLLLPAHSLSVLALNYDR
jgi:alpha-L-arabinofuranosidase